MAETIDALTVHYEEDGQVLVQELDKVILSKGAWTTILFKYQDLDRKTGDFGAPRFTLRRYRKIHGEYRQQTKFNISSVDQARKIVTALDQWIEEEESS
ncbi:hypothetical protein [Desulfohalobium retbaense]|uniref:Uncharacterized protein n=1 Tax=Desulfohalobium retbaense (strain ATCC 49708 / DSM 5692 / JCM 16813 / HR100) TaxID=485915 RepID=C8X3P1_DESRD|nr:hypothetical protein [Desulfohalobium retbaense]ACV69038.1 conserved hypothetical protein [Desulfohalobium retbaense DSM 5692]